jgi:hypothetical protein
MRTLMVLCLMTTLLTAAKAADQERRELEAHAHGYGIFNIALEGNSLAMELEAPGADIVGFEYAPETDEQKAAVARAKTILGNPMKIVALPRACGCVVKSVNVEVHIQGREAGEQDHDQGQTAYGSGSHSEFRAEYQLICSAIEKLTEITFSYFDHFNGAEKLAITIIGPGQQRRFEVSRSSRKIRLDGIM